MIGDAAAGVGVSEGGADARILAARRMHTRLPSISGEFRVSTPLTRIRWAGVTRLTARPMDRYEHIALWGRSAVLGSMCAKRAEANMTVIGAVVALYELASCSMTCWSEPMSPACCCKHGKNQHVVPRTCSDVCVRTHFSHPFRDIAHRNDIPKALKDEIKHTLQNKLHRSAGARAAVFAVVHLV